MIAKLFTTAFICLLMQGTTKAQTPTTIYTENGKIYKTNGQKVVLRGVNYNFLDDGQIIMTGSSQAYKAKIDQVALTGANSIRIPWFTDNYNHWRKQYPNTGTPQAAIDNGKLSEVLSYINSKGLIPILELHDFTCNNNWTTFMPQVQAFWTQPNMLALIQQHKQYLIINIANEFGSVRWTNNPTTSLTTFKNNYKTLVQNLRTAGIDVPIMIDAPDCGQSSSELLSVANEITAVDPLNKIIYSAHSYWYGYAPTAADVTNKINEVVASNVPFVFGEVANRQDKTGNQADGVYNIDYTYQTILSQSCQKDISWLIWAFNHDWNTEREMTPTSNIGNLTPFGQDILYNTNYGLLSAPCQATLETQETIKTHFKIYPNPAKNKVSIDQTKLVTKVEIYDLNGSLLKTYHNGFNKMDITFLKKGNYIMLIYSQKGTQQEKLLVR